MARPLTVFTYIDKDGVVRERNRCSIGGCNRIRQLTKPTHGVKDCRYELTTCAIHRKDGGSFRSSDPDKRREQIWRAQSIHLSFDEYEQLREFQDGKCHLCGVPETETGRGLFVDHDHKTGKIRGLLCCRCNVMVAWVEKNFSSIDALKDFLNMDVFEKYKDLIVQNPEVRKLRR